MKKASTKTNSVRRLKISAETKGLYKEREGSLDKDPDVPQLPLKYWSKAVIGKYYRL